MDSLHVKMNIGQGQFTRHVLGNAKKLDLLPGQPKVMEYVEMHPGCQQSDICNAWDLDKSTISGLLNRMERDGLILTAKSTQDSRKKEISLSEKGMERWQKMKHCIAQMEDTALQGIEKEAYDVFISVLDKIYDNLKNANIEMDKESHDEK